jgi:EAL domain-containing protein (putative c-di-GMP-specific phosphodiesterase class I)
MPFERSASQSYVRINHALENDDFTILFQPISKINELQEKWTHYEVLIRMLNDNNSLITPNRFLPAAERYNLINKIGQWVFKTCIKKLEENIQLLNNVNTLSVNISGASLCEPSYLKYVNSIFDQYEVAPEKICFEITETVAVSNLSEANNFISRLRDLGCKFALDDFGTGFSSFENLKYLTVDYVKIDGIFIRDLQTNKIDYEMVHSLHKIAKLMNIETIAEYVESDETLSTLKEIGVDYVQGYAISKPLTLDQVLKTNFEEKKKILRFAS